MSVELIYCGPTEVGGSLVKPQELGRDMFQPTTDVNTSSPEDIGTKGHRLQVNHTHAFKQTPVKTLTLRLCCQILKYIQRSDDPLTGELENLEL